ncbi:MAG: DUF1598 domain-containing protein [Planctomycetaceae bacterium]|jgi:hypothetical protein|nr:DUF1598 domain-containing protein [Planctomycetaceae bacterium]
MFCRKLSVIYFLAFFVLAVFTVCVTVLSQDVVNPGGSSQTSVVPITYGSSVLGGVEIDVKGFCEIAPRGMMEKVSKDMRRTFEKIPTDLSQQVPIRKVSLKKIDKAVRDMVDNGVFLPDTIRYLGGLTAVNYVVLVPEENDILLVGPSEGWKIDASGYVVGNITGSPVLRLEDLIVLFRTWYNKDAHTTITCSIDPTPDSIARMNAVKSKFGMPSPQNARAYAYELEKASGDDVVAINGVERTSRIAKMLVAADFKMKQIGLGHIQSGLRALPSYLSLLSGSPRHINPRFWLSADYGVIYHDSQKLTWKLSDVKVNAKTEDQYIDLRSNSRVASGKTDPAAVRWCKKMDEQYNSLSRVDPVFAELRNCMSLAMVVALILREDLLNKSGCEIQTITEEPKMKTPQLPDPKFVSGKSVIAKNVVACGGVEINPFNAIQAAKLDNKIDRLREQLTKTSGNNWWSR